MQFFTVIQDIIEYHEPVWHALSFRNEICRNMSLKNNSAWNQIATENHSLTMSDTQEDILTANNAENAIQCETQE